MIRKSRVSLYRSIFILIFLTTVALTTVVTFAKFVHTTIMTDFASVAKFDIEIFTQSELSDVSEDNPFILSFSEKGQTKVFDFGITNKEEVDVVCSVSFDISVQYRVLVDEDPVESIFVGRGDTVSFKVVILSDGLKAEEAEGNLIVEVKQFALQEGGGNG